MKVSTYAEVLTSDHDPMRAYRDRHMRMPGHLLRDVLEETDGRYETYTELPLRVQNMLMQVAEQTGDRDLVVFAETRRVPVSLVHLRGHDPDSTRIVYGCRFDREEGDGDIPELRS
jgi:hypothetical protein